MTLLDAGTAPGQLAVAMLLWTLALYWLLPRPGRRSVAVGTTALLAGAVVLGAWVVRQFGEPRRDDIETALFWLFAVSAVLFSALFVIQRNPARGAIAFAFVVISTCGLFLTLAAPFLMAATVIIYGGAVIVTFLFVLMLSQTHGSTDENDRSREPLLGSLAGFAFLGLVLFCHYLGGPAADRPGLPARPVTSDERAALLAAADKLTAAPTDPAGLVQVTKEVRDIYADVLGVPPTAADAAARGGGPKGIPDRLAAQIDPRSKATRAMALELRAAAADAVAAAENTIAARPTPAPADVEQVRTQLAGLRDKTLLLAGQGELPARNVAAVGYALFTDHLLGIEMAGAVLLVAAIGAVAIAGRKGAAS